MDGVYCVSKTACDSLMWLYFNFQNPYKIKHTWSSFLLKLNGKMLILLELLKTNFNRLLYSKHYSL